jgi:hypothetical protein
VHGYWCWAWSVLFMLALEGGRGATRLRKVFHGNLRINVVPAEHGPATDVCIVVAAIATRHVNKS